MFTRMIQPSAIFRDAEIEARAWSTDRLMAEIEVCRIDLNDDDPDWPGETGRFIASERLRAYESEMHRRVRVVQVPDQLSRDWAELARTVRETVPISEVLPLIGIAPAMIGSEHHSACPWCGGVDRFVSWDRPRPRYWCRQCDQRGNAIDLVMAHYPGYSHFRDAVRFLAGLVSLSGGQR